MGSEARTRLSLAALLVVTLFSFGEIFAGTDHTGPAVMAIVFGATVALLARRVGFGTILSLGVSAVVMIWYLSLLFAPGSTFYGLPTPGSASALIRPVIGAAPFLETDFAPVPLRPGYVLLVIAAMWMSAALGEVATFRWKRPLIAAMPPLCLFSLVMIVGTRRGAAFLVPVFLSALLVFWAFEASHRLRGWGRAIPVWKRDRSEVPTTTGGLARSMGAATVAAAIVGPLFLPALGEGLLSWRSGIGGLGSDGTGRVTINPLVAIQPRLIDQSDEELFTVRSDSPEYWRLISLGYFNGDEWRPNPGSTGTPEADGLPRYLFARDFVRVRQRYRLTALGGGMLPAATQMSRMRILNEEEAGRTLDDVRLDFEDGWIRLDGDIPGELEYEVESWRPRLSYSAMKSARPVIRHDRLNLYLELPDDLSPEIERIAQRWTEGFESPHEKLVAIQQRLRSFEYTLNARNAASSDYLLTFLTETRAGYCQQFAAAFAVMARTLGYPARVSVGFLPGSADPAAPDRYSVRGTDAHAWPEVFFDGFGWVAYEPTPRSTATPGGYTRPVIPVGGIDGIGGGNFGDVPPGVGDPRTRVMNDREASVLTSGGVDDPASRGVSENPLWERAFRRLRSIVVALLAAFLALMPLVKQRRIARRYRSARDVRAGVVAAFAHFEDEAAALFEGRKPTESAPAYAQRLAEHQRVPRRAALRLADFYEAAIYGRGALRPTQAREARRLAGDLRTRLWTTATWWERLQRLFSPRGVFTGLSWTARRGFAWARVSGVFRTYG